VNVFHIQNIIYTFVNFRQQCFVSCSKSSWNLNSAWGATRFFYLVSIYNWSNKALTVTIQTSLTLHTLHILRTSFLMCVGSVVGISRKTDYTFPFSNSRLVCHIKLIYCYIRVCNIFLFLFIEFWLCPLNILPVFFFLGNSISFSSYASQKWTSY
jgi:hypothetical protein